MLEVPGEVRSGRYPSMKQCSMEAANDLATLRDPDSNRRPAHWDGWLLKVEGSRGGGKDDKPLFTSQIAKPAGVLERSHVPQADMEPQYLDGLSAVVSLPQDVGWIWQSHYDPERRGLVWMACSTGQSGDGQKNQRGAQATLLS